MPTARLELLGPPRLVRDGAVTPLPWQRPTALLAFLACQPDWVDRDRLAALLQPDRGEDDAKAYLRRLLHRAKAVAGDEALEIEPLRLRWRGSSDVREFIATGDARDWPQALQLAPRPLLDSVALLADDGIDHWFEQERQRLAGRRRAALIGCLEQSVPGETQRAAWLQQLVDADPLDEDGVQYALSRAGSELEQSIALAAFDTLQRRLAHEMALRPLSATQELAASLRARSFALPTGISMTTAQARPPAGDAAPFFGREAEVERLRQQLADPQCRLLTLLGPGGMGKTRLARRLLELAGEGNFVDLRDVDDELGLLRALSETLGLPQSERAIKPLLIAALAQRQGLIVLDNFEHLAASTPLLAELMAASPQVRWLVTSRVALGLATEYRIELGGLGVRHADDAGAQLFVHHARRLGYRPAAAEYDDVLRIAQLLEGSPLALELAASWSAVMAPAEIAREIERDLGFVAAEAAADRPAEHRSLRAVFESSWRRLPTDEQKALAALTVCAGFDRLLAQQVAGVEAPMLLRLAGKSLLRRHDGRRFSMHAQVAAFAREHLAPAQQARLRDAHAQAVLGQLAAAGDLKMGTHRPQVLAAWRAEFDNLRLAWRHAAQQGAKALIGPAVESLAALVFCTHRYEEAIELFAHAARALADDERLERRLRRWRCACVMALGRHAEVAEEVESLARTATEPDEHAHLALARAMQYGRMGEFAKARDAIAEGLRYAEATGDPYLVVRTRLNMGVTEWSVGNAVVAEGLIAQAIAQAERCGAEVYRSRALRMLGILRREQGRDAEARALMAQALEQFEAMGDRFDAAYSLRNLASLCSDTGDPAAGLDYAQRSLVQWRDIGAESEVAESLFMLGYCQVRAGQLDAARDTLLDTLRAALKMDFRPLVLRCLGFLAVLRAGVEREQALRELAFVLHHPALRGSDRPVLEREWQALAPTDAESAAAAGDLDQDLERAAALALARG